MRPQGCWYVALFHAASIQPLMCLAGYALNRFCGLGKVVSRCRNWTQPWHQVKLDICAECFQFAHPDSHCFGVGKVERDQVEDYAARTGWTITECERWLAPVLNYDPVAAAQEAVA